MVHNKERGPFVRGISGLSTTADDPCVDADHLQGAPSEIAQHPGDRGVLASRPANGTRALAAGPRGTRTSGLGKNTRQGIAVAGVEEAAAAASDTAS